MRTEEAGDFAAGFCLDLSPRIGGKWTLFSDNRSFSLGQSCFQGRRDAVCLTARSKKAAVQLLYQEIRWLK